MTPMTFPQMTFARFQAIVEAYGAEPRRWPEAERDAAAAFVRHDPEAAEACLIEARAMDAMLDLAQEPLTPEMEEDLHYRAMAHFAFATAPKPRRAPVIWAGLGLAACLAGVMLGVNVSLKSMDDMRAQTVLEQTAMIDME